MAIIADVWRTADLTAGEEASILKEFGPLLTRADHKFRADRLLYKEQVQAALRVAALAGPDVKLLAAARASVINQASPAAQDAAIAAVPKSLANDAGLTFARIQRARRANKIQDATALMVAAPRDPATLVDGDAWWVERRLIARKLLDLGDAKTAFAICANHAASSETSTIEAEFHAGWIALRFLDDSKAAAVHFDKAAAAAETPISKARAAYWQGRAAEAQRDSARAQGFYQAAALQPISFYGQLASAKLGRTSIDLRQPAAVAQGDDRREAIRVVELLYALGERDIALPLAFEIAKTEAADSQVAALAAVLTKAGDARGTLLVGKFATQRGLWLDESAFPTFGIPDYQPLVNSADRAVVYAIARQESEFEQRSVSTAGAKGLMQLITPTARQTAQKCGVSFDDVRLATDAAFNARIGAAHLGQLLSEQRGSYILTFAAYNAGSQRVKDWIAAYGDPRQPGVDPVDWIERIPFTETRNYVQRVFENLQVYRLRFGQSPKLLMVGADAGAPDKRT
jgi:soluble lytic murein transglycosylase